MARSTTLAVWRSYGGDQTRTATPGSMAMHVPFYIANAAVSGNVTTVAPTASLPYPPNVVLPANAVVTAVTITATGSGNIDMGFTPLNNVGPGQKTTLGTPVATAFLSGASVASAGTIGVNALASGGGTYIGNVANATNVVVITSEPNGSNVAGSVSGYINYFVLDNGTQST